MHSFRNLNTEAACLVFYPAEIANSQEEEEELATRHVSYQPTHPASTAEPNTEERRLAYSSQPSYAITTTFGAPDTQTPAVSQDDGSESTHPSVAASIDEIVSATESVDVYSKHFVLSKGPGGGFGVLVNHPTSAGVFVIKGVSPGATDAAKQLSPGDAIVRVNGEKPVGAIEELQTILGSKDVVEFDIERKKHVPMNATEIMLQCLSGADALEALMEVKVIGGCDTAFGGLFVHSPTTRNQQHVVHGDRIMSIGGHSVVTATHEEGQAIIKEFMERPYTSIEMDAAMIVGHGAEFDFDSMPHSITEPEVTLLRYHELVSELLCVFFGLFVIRKKKAPNKLVCMNNVGFGVSDFLAVGNLLNISSYFPFRKLVDLHYIVRADTGV